MKHRETHADSPAFPLSDDAVEDFSLTKREYFAGLAMQGAVAFHGVARESDALALLSIVLADALIAELNK